MWARNRVWGDLGPWIFRDRVRIREREGAVDGVGGVVWGLDPARAPGLLIFEDVAGFKVGVVCS